MINGKPITRNALIQGIEEIKRRSENDLKKDRQEKIEYYTWLYGAVKVKEFIKKGWL